MKLTPITDTSLLEHFDDVISDGIDIFLLARGKFRAALLHGTRMVNQMRANHDLGILESLILAHGYMAAALMATGTKGNDRVSIHIDCDGPVGGLHAESTAQGQVRGYLKNTHIPIDHPVDSFDTAPYFGEGTVTVTRFPENARQPFSGQIEIAYGNIAQDITRYYAISEQTPTALSLSVQFDHDGQIVGAGGLLLQALPRSARLPTGTEHSSSTQQHAAQMDEAADEEAWENYESLASEIERRVREIPSLGHLFAEGKSQAQIVREHFADLEPDVIATRPVEFACQCSRERFSGFVSALPAAELEDIKNNGPFPLRINCHNCNSMYEFSREEVQHL